MIIFDEKQVFKALAETIRLRIMVLLADGECCVCDLMEVLGLPQSTISRHLSVLRQSGLITDQWRGKWVYYRINDGLEPVYKPVITLMERFQEKEPYVSDLRSIRKLRANQKEKRC